MKTNEPIPYSNPLLAVGRLALLGAATAAALGALALGRVLLPESARAEHKGRWTTRWARMAAAVCGIRVRSRGPAPAEGSMLAPNHVGYMDIVALAAQVPAVFVPKSEVLDWPIVGRFVRATDQIAIKRGKTKSLIEAGRAIAERLRAGRTVCVFLEGTSTGGDRVLPFMPSLVDAAQKARAMIVPVTLRWSANRPGLEIERDLAFYKQETKFCQHIFRLLGLNGFGVEVIYGDPIDPTTQDRKVLAKQLHDEVESRLEVGGVERVSKRKKSLGHVRALGVG